MAATRDEFLKAVGTSRRYTIETLPNGTAVRLQSITEGERAKLEISAIGPDGKISVARAEQTRRRLLALCLVDDQGCRLFQDGDLPQLANIDGATAGLLNAACRKHCGLDDVDVEALAKNSEATGAANSPTT